MLLCSRVFTCRRHVKDPAHNPRARAPEHVELVNNFTNADHTQHAKETLLPTEQATWNKLGTHVQQVAAPLTRCCFQCGMLYYPTGGDTICVANVQRKSDCRAYRVFRYYIKKLIGYEYDRLESHAFDDDAARQAEAASNVFLCERCPARGGCKV